MLSCATMRIGRQGALASPVRRTVFCLRLRRERWWRYSPPLGPPTALKLVAGIRLGILNVRSAKKRIVVLHDTIRDLNIDFLALTETWISSTAPDAIKQDVAPKGYSVHHAHRGRMNVDEGMVVLRVVWRSSTRIGCR